MMILFKKIGFFFLAGLRPVYLWAIKRYPAYFAELRRGHQDPYHSGMVERFNRFHEWIFKPYFEKVHLDQSELAHLKELSNRGTLVYVMKNQGQLEYSFFNHLFLKEKIPLAHFANGSRTLFWHPVRDILRTQMAMLDAYYQSGLLADPIESGYLTRLLTEGRSALLNLHVSREFIFRVNEEAFEFIPPLLLAAQKATKPVYLVTQQFLYDRRPEKSRKSWYDFLLGEKSNPGTFRKLILFCLSYRSRATVKFGKPLDLVQFVKSNGGLGLEEQTNILKNLLLSNLLIERRCITGPVQQPRELLFEKMQRLGSFKEEVQLIAKDQNTSMAEVHRQVRRYYSEIAASLNYTYIDLYDRLIRWLINNIYDGLDVDIAGLAEVKRVAGKHPIVLVPSHKSHLDYLLLSYIFYNHDLSLPHVCAGVNLNFWPVSRFLRRGGAFFIRRSLGDNRVYKLVLQSYLKLLLSDGYSTEFFIEGTRSRTGKLLKPKMGILSMLVGAYQNGAAEDVYFVPISINYERIVEEMSYVQEGQGASKEKESFIGLVRARKSLRKKYGKVFVQFAEPISLQNYLQEEPAKEPRKIVEDLAYRITYNINKVSVVTSTAMVAAALLSYPKKGIPEHDLLQHLTLLQKYLEFKGARLSSVIQKQGFKAYTEALVKLRTSGTISLYQDFKEQFFTIDPLKRRLLDYHKNNVVHFFVSLACFSKIFLLLNKPEVLLHDVKQKYESLKTLLHFDFTFSARVSLEEHLLKIIQYYEKLGVLHFDSLTQTLRWHDVKKIPVVQYYGGLLDNFYESYLVTLLYIEHVPFAAMEQKKLIEAIVQSGKVLFAKGDLRHLEALNQFNIKSALAVFADLGLLKISGHHYERHFDEDGAREWHDLLKNLLEVRGGDGGVLQDQSVQGVNGGLGLVF